MELAALIVSIVAIVISIFVAISQVVHDNKINRITLESVYHQEIYKEYLIEKIPVARRYLKFDDRGLLCETNRLCLELQQMVYDSLYFFYYDRSFYDELQEKCSDLEDYLVQLSQQPLSAPNQNSAEDEIHSRIEDIYDLIGRKYVKG